MKTLSLIASLMLLSTVFASAKTCCLAGPEDTIPRVHAKATYTILKEEDVIYAKGLRHESINSSNATVMPLALDVYVPDNESGNRPVFVFIHGGGFAGGTKQQGRIIEWANYYTSRGWVFISIDYRLKRDMGTVPQSWADLAATLPQGKKTGQFVAMYPAQRDAKAALRWVIANADNYHINTNYITVGGGSAGAITAISMGVSKPEDFTGEVSVEQDPTLISANTDQTFQVKTIIDLWGSKSALDALEKLYGHQRFDNSNAALFIAHGTEDSIVPFAKAEELKLMYEASVVPYVYYPLQGKGHGAWGATVNNKQLVELAFDFIVEQQGLRVE